MADLYKTPSLNTFLQYMPPSVFFKYQEASSLNRQQTVIIKQYRIVKISKHFVLWLLTV